MSSKAYWFLQDHIIYVQNAGDLTAEDFRSVDKEIIAFMKEAKESSPSARVHVLVDSLQMTKLPSLLDLEGGRILKYMQQPNCGTTVVVGVNNSLLNIISRLLTATMGVKLHMTDSLDKAVAYYKNLDPSVDGVPDVEAWKENLS